MARVKRGTTVRAKHNKILKLAKGYRGRNSKVFTIAKEKVEKGLKYAYRDRKTKKTDIRQLWIV
ncbi:MAG: 50S ribosomal protein L20, partial [Alphaproteobacteria bacterium]|nr:50S ribosomal protein L20 [Alphaproteobacteria bacterium]